MGLLWAAAAKLEHLQARPAKALAAAEEALRVLAVTHGGGGAVVEAVRRVLFEVGQEARFGGGGGTLGRGPGDGSGSDEE